MSNDDSRNKYICNSCGKAFYEGDSNDGTHGIFSCYCKTCLLKMIKDTYEVFHKYLTYCKILCPEDTTKIDNFLSTYTYQKFEDITKNNISDFLSLFHSNSTNEYLTYYKKYILNTELFSTNGKYDALWNSFLKKYPDVNGEICPVKIEHACTRCGSDLYSQKMEYTEYKNVISNPDYICHQCEQWKKILRDFKEEYGWNPDWKFVLEDLESLSRVADQQANPNNLLPILQKHGITMSEEIIGFWNSLFDKYHGDGIIKCYAVADGLQGAAEQAFKRFLGGIFGSNNIR